MLLLKQLRIREKLHDDTKLQRFVPNRAQAPFLSCTARITAFIAANKIGKTTAGVKKTLDFVLEKGRIFRVISGLGFEKGIRDTIIPELKKWLPPSRLLREKPNSQGVTVKLYVLAYNGEESVISFMSADQDPMAFEGDLIDGAWIDEPVPKYCYTGTLRGLLVSNGPLWFTLTPLTEPWIYNDIYQSLDPEIQCFQGSIHDALKEHGGHLTKEQVESFISKLPDDERPARVLGEFKHLIGRVYGEYDPRIHRIEPFYIPPHWPVWCSIDPHQRKPHAALFMAVSPEEEWFICNEVYFKAGIQDFGKEVLAVGRQYNMAAYLIDTSSETPDWNRRETARSQLEKIGLHTRLARKKNQKSAGRMIIKQALAGLDGGGSIEGRGSTPWLYVFNTCKRTHFEFMNYVWDDRRNPDAQGILEEPKKVNDEMMDDLNYIVVDKPRYSRPGIRSITGPEERD
ncbi:MAG TPA: terminase family protein [bacterium]|nr:terminase family protein [bacterium]